MNLQEFQEQQQLEAYLWKLVESVLRKNGAIITGRGLTINETAKQLKIHPSTVRKLITYGKVQAFQIGSRIIIDRLSLDKYLASVQIKPSLANIGQANL